VDAGLIANPQRGTFSFNSNNFGSQVLPGPLKDMLTYLNGLRQSRGMTTVVPSYGLSAWKTTTILPQNILDLVDSDFPIVIEIMVPLQFLKSSEDICNN